MLRAARSWLVVCVLVLTATALAAGAGAAELKAQVEACFPDKVAGLVADEAVWDAEPGNSLAGFLSKGHEVSRIYRGPSEYQAYVTANSLGMFRSIMSCNLPVTKKVKLNGREGAVIEGQDLVFIMGDKAAVVFSFIQGGSPQEAKLLELAKDFNFNALDNLLAH